MTRDRWKIRAMISAPRHAGAQSQQARRTINGASREIGARPMPDGAVVKRLVNGGSPPRRRSRLKRRARSNRATAVPIARPGWLAWAINRRHSRKLAAIGASAKRLPGKPRRAASSLPGKRPVGSQQNRSRRGHAVARAIKPRRSRNGTSLDVVRQSQPGARREQPASGDSPMRLLPGPAVRLSQPARER